MGSFFKLVAGLVGVSIVFVAQSAPTCQQVGELFSCKGTLALVDDIPLFSTGFDLDQDESVTFSFSQQGVLNQQGALNQPTEVAGQLVVVSGPEELLRLDLGSSETVSLPPGHYDLMIYATLLAGDSASLAYSIGDFDELIVLQKSQVQVSEETLSFELEQGFVATRNDQIKLYIAGFDTLDANQDFAPLESLNYQISSGSKVLFSGELAGDLLGEPIEVNAQIPIDETGNYSLVIFGQAAVGTNSGLLWHLATPTATFSDLVEINDSGANPTGQVGLLSTFSLPEAGVYDLETRFLAVDPEDQANANANMILQTPAGDWISLGQSIDNLSLSTGEYRIYGGISLSDNGAVFLNLVDSARGSLARSLLVATLGNYRSLDQLELNFTDAVTATFEDLTPSSYQFRMMITDGRSLSVSGEFDADGGSLVLGDDPTTPQVESAEFLSGSYFLIGQVDQVVPHDAIFKLEITDNAGAVLFDEHVVYSEPESTLFVESLLLPAGDYAYRLVDHAFPTEFPLYTLYLLGDDLVLSLTSNSGAPLAGSETLAGGEYSLVALIPGSESQTGLLGYSVDQLSIDDSQDADRGLNGGGSSGGGGGGVLDYWLLLIGGLLWGQKITFRYRQ